ncbi:MAG: LysR family transcriptional regulator [Myxococcaceae bacterium]|nr:MAG: LysR family transcriptional regulator [Myxococcaceae bacterium]
MTTFVRVVEAGSLSAAGKQLHVSVAAVSRQISALERELGSQLVARTTRRMTVTTAGQEYYQRCVRILREVDEAQAVGRSGGLEGTLRISLPVTLGFRNGASPFATLLAKHPALRFDLRFEDRLVDLVLEDIDVAIRVAALPPLSTEIIAHPLSRWGRIVVASPQYVRRHGEPKTPASLGEHLAVSPVRDAVTETWKLVNGTETAHVRMKVRCSSNAGNVLRDLALQGVGVALFPEWFVAEDLRERRLRHLLPGWESEPVVIHALYRAAHRNERRVRLFVDHLRAVYSEFERGT